MSTLTGNQRTLEAKALTHAGGFRETGVLPSRCADYQPARSRRGFFYLRVQPRIRRGLTDRDAGNALLWASPETAQGVAKAAPQDERLPGEFDG